MSASSLLAAGPIANGLFGLIDSLFTTEDERLQYKLKLLSLEQSGALAQISVNAKEAEHAHLFVAGWRPYIAWVCGVAFSWSFVLQPVLVFILVLRGVPSETINMLPVLDLSAMMPVLMGMLGLGAFRSFEKIQGVERNTLDRSGKR